MNYWRILRTSFSKNPEITIRSAVLADVDPYIKAVQKVWPEEMWVDPERVKSRIKTNPGGQVVALVDGEFWGMATSIQLIDYNYDKPPSWYDVTDDGWCTNHNPAGRTFFGVDLTILPGSPKGTFDALAAGLAQVVISRKGEVFLLGERLPGYREFATNMSAEEYIWAKDGNGDYLDPQIGMYQKVPGLKIVKVIPNYINDPESLNYGLLLQWTNPFRELPFSRLWAWLFGWLYRLESAYEVARKAG